MQVDHSGDHSEDSRDILLLDFRQHLRQYAEDCSTGLIREAYDRAAREMPEAAAHLSFVQVERSMHNWRRKRWPKNPRSAENALEIFTEAAGMKSN